MSGTRAPVPFDGNGGQEAPMDECTCLHTCAEDPASACSLSGRWHVHPSQFLWDGLGACPVHPEAPGDL